MAEIKSREECLTKRKQLGEPLAVLLGRIRGNVLPIDNDFGEQLVFTREKEGDSWEVLAGPFDENNKIDPDGQLAHTWTIMVHNKEKDGAWAEVYKLAPGERLDEQGKLVRVNELANIEEVCNLIRTLEGEVGVLPIGSQKILNNC